NGRGRQTAPSAVTPTYNERASLEDTALKPYAWNWCYLSSTEAPASSSCALIESASSWLAPSLTVPGAPSTRSFASLRPRPVTARTTLITWIFLSPAAVMTTSNEVFSSAAAAPSPPAAAPPGAAPPPGPRGPPPPPPP